MPTLTYHPFCQYHYAQSDVFWHWPYVPAVDQSDQYRQRSTRRAHYASTPYRKLPHWTLTDTGADGAERYRTGRRSTPAVDGFTAMLVDAVRHMRRWQYYSDWR